MITQKEMLLDFIRSKDFIAKIACLVLAVILWSYIGNRNDNEIMFNIRAEVVNLSDDLVITDMEKRYIGVRIRGEAEDIENIDKENIAVTVNLSDAIIGKPYRYDLTLEYTDIPDTVDISLEERKIFVTVNRRISKQVYIRPRMTGKVAQGYLMGNIYIEPERVVLYGTSDMIQKIDHVQTEEFSISGISSTMITDVPLDTSRLEYSDISTESVTVRVQVFSDENIFTYEPELDVYGLMENYSYDISHTSCTVYVQSLDGSEPEITKNDVKIWADLDPVYSEDFKTKSGRIVAEIRRKAGVKAMINRNAENIRIISIVPDSIIVKIQR
ncbi:MAG: YbbR-like domain-containing protein [Spirochaetota bacterium]